MNRSILKFLFSETTLRFIKTEIRPDHYTTDTYTALQAKWKAHVAQDTVALSLGHGQSELTVEDVAVAVAALNGNDRYNYLTIMLAWLRWRWSPSLLGVTNRDEVWEEFGLHVTANQLDSYFRDSSGLFRAQETGRDLNTLIALLPGINAVFAE